MYSPFLYASRKVGAVVHSPFLLPKAPALAFYRSLHQNQEPLRIGSPARVRKLIASEPDPLLAYEIFDLASRQPSFRHSYGAYHTLIVKLGRSRHFSLMHRIISRLKSDQCPVSSTLFSNVIQLYGDANMPEEALKSFYNMLQLGFKLLPKHLNRILKVLVAQRNYVHPAFDLFKAAHRYGVSPNIKSYNILMRAFCLNDEISIAYSLFNGMFKGDVVPNVESYRILMQGLCRKSQVNTAVDLLEDMLNKGYVPDALSYTTLLNSLCRKKKLKEAYKLLCRMKVKGCNPDIVHYNTVILGFCREGRATDACKVLGDMSSNGCFPNLISYRALVTGLCNQGMFEEAYSYVVEMLGKGFSPHFSVFHALVKSFCNVGKIDEACGVLGYMLNHGESPHVETWTTLIPRICEVDDMEKMHKIFREVLKVEIKGDTKLVEAIDGLGDYMVSKMSRRLRRN